MKKLLVFAVLASFSIVATAQEESIRFGAKAGLNLSNISGDKLFGEIDTDSRTSFHIGAVVEIPLGEKFAFAPELVYSAQGFKTEFAESNEFFTFSTEQTTKLNYLNLPLMAKYYIAQGFSIQAGPQIGFLLSAKSEGEDNDDGEITTFDEDIDKNINGIDFGLNVGLGYQLEAGIFFDARYNIGLSDVNDVDFEAGDIEFKNQNSVIQLSVGYKF